MELPIKIAITSASTIITTIIFGWWGFPALFNYGLRSALTLGNGTEIRTVWQKIPFPINFKVYLFNVTNAGDVLNGDRPMLDEIGPYIFDEWRQKVDIVENDTEDTIEFNMKMTWYFNKKLTKGLTGDEIVTIPHPVISSILLKLAQEKPMMLPMAYKAINIIFDNPESIFLTAKVKDILFDGIFIDCNVTDFVAYVVCSQLKEERNMKPVGEKGLLFSYFGYKNGTLEKRMKVKRGIENSLDLNRVVEFDNKSSIDVWSDEDCDKFQGTESTVFPPLLPETEDLFAFVPVLCRNLKIKYIEKTTFRNFPVTFHNVSFGDMSKNENEKCYCPTKQKCWEKGTTDLNKCMGAPVVVTLPHFYDADESYLTAVRGIHPEPKKHGMEFYFEPISGTVLKANNRIQFNFAIQSFPNISITQNISKMMLPILWIDEGVELNSTFMQHIDSQVFFVLRINNIIRWTTITIATCGLFISLYMLSHLKRGFSLTNLHLKEQDIQSIPDKSAMTSSLSSIILSVNKEK